MSITQATQSNQITRLAFDLINLIPASGQTTPPNGATPDEMRREIGQIANGLDGEILLFAFWVMVRLLTSGQVEH